MRPRPWVPMPMKPRFNRSLGLVSAAQIPEGSRKGAEAVRAAVDLRKDRRDKFCVFMVCL